jgi:uncharacterized protein YodC (DUF2158 family)
MRTTVILRLSGQLQRFCRKYLRQLRDPVEPTANNYGSAGFVVCPDRFDGLLGAARFEHHNIPNLELHHTLNSNSSLKTTHFESDSLSLIAPAENFQNAHEPNLRIGNTVQLNSGGPAMLVVDFLDSDRVVVAWRNENGEAVETEFPRVCVHRVSPV